MRRRHFLATATSTAFLRAQTRSTVTMIAAEGEPAKWWPRWRGPSGQGLAAGSGYPDKWSGTQNVEWKVEVPGRGNSSPTVYRDRIFLTSAEDAANRKLYCYHRGDGRLLWACKAPEAQAEKLYWKNTYASSTPVTDGNRVYNYFGNAGVIAVDFDGKIAWHRSLGPITLYHGSGGSPLLYRDRLILYQDQKNGAFITALSTANGEVLWKTEREERIGWGTPVAIRAGGQDQIVVSSQDRVTAYHPDNGKLIWWVRGNTMETIPTPVVGDGLLFCCSGRAGPTLAIRPGGTGDVTDTHVAWQTPRGSPFIPSPLYHGGLLYTVNDMAAIATCLDSKTGAVKWQGRLGPGQERRFHRIAGDRGWQSVLRQ